MRKKCRPLFLAVCLLLVGITFLLPGKDLYASEGNQAEISELIKTEGTGSTLTYGGITYAYDSEDDTYSVADCDVNIVNAVILSEIQGKDVVKIEKNAFDDCANLTSVSVPESIVSGLSAYDRCAFVRCGNLARIDVAEGNSAYCSVDGVVFSKDISELCVFPKGRGGTYEIPEGTLNIDMGAFTNCDKLVSIKLPSSVTAIDIYAFTLCDNLVTVELSEGITQIGHGAFKDCVKLENINIPESVTILDTNVFEGCSSLKSIVLPGNVANLRNDVFSNCVSLKNIILPEHLKTIDSNVFNNCTGLESIVIPDTVISIGDRFIGCTSLSNIMVGEENTVYKSVDGVLYNKEMSTLLKCPAAKGINNFKVPEGVKKIGAEAFAECGAITGISLPDTLEEIGHLAFYKSGITEITIGKNVREINASTKSGNCFPFKGAAKLCKIKVAEDNPYYSDYEGCLYSKDKKTLIMCPEGKETITIYKAAEAIAYRACQECCLLSDVIIPAGVTVIGGSSFTGCSGLKTIEIPDSVTEIVDGTVYGQPAVFEGCTNLVIKCLSGSYAEEYAIQNQIAYELINTLTHTHRYVSEETKKATCTACGIITYTCIDCGDTYQEEIPAIGHRIVIDEAVSATCTASGKTEGSHCSVCGETIIAQKEIPAIGHNYKCIVTKATLKKNGNIANKCEICGKEKDKSVIYYPKNIKLSKTSCTYNGKAQKPAVIVTDSRGQKISNDNYTITYSNNKKIGTATAVIEFQGNYAGRIKKSFTIKPKGTSISQIITAKRGVIVKWKKQTNQINGYQIQYSTSSKFTKKATHSVTISKKGTVTKKISKLKARKTYYVRIRTYKTVKENGKTKKIYSEWSKVKKATIKR